VATLASLALRCYDSSMRCASCGYKNDLGATTCQLCSHKLGEAPRTGFMLGSGPDPNAGNVGGATATRRFGSNVERHYVVPSVGDYIKLEPAFTYLIGRDESCRIRIGSPHVSRKHAEIHFEGTPPKAIVKDLGSQNGTRVNAQALPKEGTRELKDRDEIEVGGNKFLYCRLNPGESEKLLRGDVGETTVVGGGEDSDPNAATIDEESADLRGNVAIMPLSEVLKRLDTLKATGVLMVDAEGAQGVLQLQGGKPVGGMFGGSAGAQAAVAISKITKGKFRFEAAEAPEPPPTPESQRPTQKMSVTQPPSGLPAAKPAVPPAGPRPAVAPPTAPRPAAPLPPPRPAAPPPGAAPPPRPAAPPPPRPQAPPGPPKPPPPKPPGAP